MKETKLTGGGQPPPPLSSQTEEIMGMCPGDFQSIVNPWDDDISYSTGGIDLDTFLMPKTGDSRKKETTDESHLSAAQNNQIQRKLSAIICNI